jgi:nucleotide-binding universal stress UspA family protein
MNSSIDSILCATDLSRMGNAAVELAYGFLAHPGSTVHIVHVVEPPLELESEDVIDVARRARRRLERLIPKSAETNGVRTELCVGHEVDLAERILKEAKRTGAQVIVLGTHGASGVGRRDMGSVASQVLRDSELPVLLVSDRSSD